MYINDDESDWKKIKTSSDFNKKTLSKKRQFSNDFYDPETMKDFTRFTDIININTFGSQPIVMYKKIKRLQSPIMHTKNFNDIKDKKISATSREKMPKRLLRASKRWRNSWWAVSARLFSQREHVLLMVKWDVSNVALSR